MSYEKNLDFSSNNKYIIFTDGSCKPNNKSKKSRGGYSALFVSGKFDGVKIYGNLDMWKS